MVCGHLCFLSRPLRRLGRYTVKLQSRRDPTSHLTHRCAQASLSCRLLGRLGGTTYMRLKQGHLYQRQVK